MIERSSGRAGRGTRGGGVLGTEIGQTSRDQFAPVRAPDSDPDSTRPPSHKYTRTSTVRALFAHISTRDPLDLPFSMSMHPLSLPFRPLFPIPASFPWIPRSARALAPSCQEIFVTESRVVSLGEQATPKVSRLSGPAAPSIRATIIGQLKPGESVRVTCHPIIIRCPRGGSTTYPRDRAWVAETNSTGERERGREIGQERNRGWGTGMGFKSQDERGRKGSSGGPKGGGRNRLFRSRGFGFYNYGGPPGLSLSLFLSLTSLSPMPPRSRFRLATPRRNLRDSPLVLSLTILLRVNQCGQHALSLTPRRMTGVLLDAAFSRDGRRLPRYSD